VAAARLGAVSVKSGVGAGSANDGAAALEVAAFGPDAVATEGDVAGAGVGAGSLGEAALGAGVVATEGDVAGADMGAGSLGAAVSGFAVAIDEDAAGAGSFPVARDAPDPFRAAAMAEAGVGAGSARERADVSAGDAAAGAPAVVSARAIGIEHSETKAAALSAIAEIRRTFWVMKTSLTRGGGSRRAIALPLPTFGLGDRSA
jgi:hypothetical protein